MKKITKMTVARRVVDEYDAMKSTNPDRVIKTKEIIAAISEQNQMSMTASSTYYYLIRKGQKAEALATPEGKKAAQNARRRELRALKKAAEAAAQVDTNLVVEGGEDEVAETVAASN